MQALSYVSGSSHPPLMEITIGEALRIARDKWPAKMALISRHQGVRWTWSELSDRVDALATGLLNLGLEKGDRVGVWAPNCAEWALAQFATARVGLIQVTINPAYRMAELEYALHKVGVSALICADRCNTSNYVGMVEALAPEIAASRPGCLAAARLPRLRAVISLGDGARPGWLPFSALLTSVDEPKLRSAIAATRYTDAINIQFTSGTTGQPKGATLSHHNILNNASYVGAGMDLGVNDKLCIPVPLYHCFGMVMGNLACVVHGATMVYASAAFDPHAVLQAVAEERCTALYGVPTMFIRELEEPRFAGFDLSSLRTGLMAGSPCPIEVMRKLVDRMHMRDIGIAYGMTETSPVSFQSSAQTPLEKRVATVGVIQPHLEAKVVDAEGATVARGQPGELCVRGYAVMLGYWDDLAQTQDAIDGDGWMHTGDIAVIHEDGYCNIVGRIKDMIIRGGENIYPREIEEFIFRHPKVEMVQVVGIPDARYGEELCAWIRLRAGTEATDAEFRDFCRDQIAHYKIPRYIRFVNEFPMTATGKVQKFEIRAAMVRELALREQTTA